MRVRVLLQTPVLAVLSVFGIGGTAASAAVLYTSNSHSVVVANGTTALATAGTVVLTSGGTPVNTCSSSSLILSTTTNGGTVTANVTGGSFSGCRFSTTVNASPPSPWVLRITGLGTVSGSNTVFVSAVRAISVTFAGGAYVGDLLSGVFASQPTASGAPISLVLNYASRLAGPLTSNGQVTGTYRLTGTAASYSLGGPF